MKTLRAPRMERCTGCNSCSLACARLVHKSLSWHSAGIRIASSGGIASGFEARLCIACNDAPCAARCPTGAMKQRPGGGVIFRRNVCIQCAQCADACPIDAIALDFDKHPYVCVNCGQCVAFCPQGCLEMEELTDGKVVPHVE
jgi:Fe-S-cluster-containing dehydrogenase component